MLRDYEILYIVRPELDEEGVGEAAKSVESLVASFGGDVEKTDVWGRRRLAYEVDHLREGTYVLTNFKLEPDRVTELESSLRISETVFRHLVTRRSDKSSQPAPRRPRRSDEVPARREAPSAAPEAAPAAEVAPETAPAAEAAPEAAPAPEPVEAEAEA